METANYENRYASMSDGELAELITAGRDSLNEEAKHAFHAELRKRGLTLAALREQYPPELPPTEIEREPAERDPKVSVLIRQFGVFPGFFPIGFVLLALLFILLMHEPYGIQTVTLVGYTGLVFLFVFCDTGKRKGYSLFQKAVQQKLPRLLAIHVVLLIVVFTWVTVVPWLRRFVPDSWLVEHVRRGIWNRAGGNLFEYLAVLIGTAICMIQVWISRKILTRSVEADRPD
jgi:NADH:ubiquinone oxidoreductase subunit 6 (subunit J)